MIKSVPCFVLVSALPAGAASAQMPVGDTPTRARAADGGFTSWREHNIDDPEVPVAP